MALDLQTITNEELSDKIEEDNFLVAEQLRCLKDEVLIEEDSNTFGNKGKFKRLGRQINRQIKKAEKRENAGGKFKGDSWATVLKNFSNSLYDLSDLEQKENAVEIGKKRAEVDSYYYNIVNNKLTRYGMSLVKKNLLKEEYNILNNVVKRLESGDDITYLEYAKENGFNVNINKIGSLITTGSLLGGWEKIRNMTASDIRKSGRKYEKNIKKRVIDETVGIGNKENIEEKESPKKDICNPKNFKSGMDFADEYIYKGYKNGVYGKGGAEILHTAKNLANIAILAYGFWNLVRKGAIKQEEGAIVKGLGALGGRFMLNHINVGGLGGMWSDFGEEYLWDSDEISADYEDLSGEAQSSLKGNVRSIFSGMTIASIRKLNVLKYNTDGKIIGMNYKKMRKFIEDNEDLTEDQKKKKLTALNQFETSEGGNNGSKLGPVMEDLGLNLGVMTNEDNQDNGISNFVDENAEDSMSQDELILSEAQADWMQKLSGVDKAKKKELVKYATEMYKDGIRPLNFEVSGSDIYIKDGIDGKKVKLESNKISVNGNKFPPANIAGLNDTRGLLYLAFYTSKAMKKGESGNGKFVYNNIPLWSDINYETKHQTIVLGMKKNEKYVDALNDIGDDDFVIKEYVKFLNKIKGVSEDDEDSDETNIFDESKYTKLTSGWYFSDKKANGTTDKKVTIKKGSVSIDLKVDTNGKIVNGIYKAPTSDKEYTATVNGNEVIVTVENLNMNRPIITTNSINLKFTKKNQIQNVMSIRGGGSTITKKQIKLGSQQFEIKNINKTESSAVSFGDWKVWISDSGQVFTKYIGTNPTNTSNVDFKLILDYTDNGSTKTVETSTKLKKQKETVVSTGDIDFKENTSLVLRSGTKFYDIDNGEYKGSWAVEIPSNPTVDFNKVSSGKVVGNVIKMPNKLQIVGAYTNSSDTKPIQGTYFNGVDVGDVGDNPGWGSFVQIKNNKISIKKWSEVNSMSDKSGLNGFRTISLVKGGSIPSGLQGTRSNKWRVMAQTATGKRLVIDANKSQTLNSFAKDLKNKKRGGYKIKNAVLVDSGAGYAENAKLFSTSNKQVKPNSSFVDNFKNKTNNMITFM